jgi:WD40 repeat protein
VVLDYYCSVPDEVSVLKRVKAVPLDVPEGGGCASAVAWNPDPAHAQIIAGTYDNALISWDADTGKVTNSVSLKDSGTSSVAGVAFSGDGTKVIVGSVDGPNGRIHVLNVADLTTVAVWPTDSFATIDTSADGRYVVTGGGSARAVTVWDFEDHDQPLHVFSEAPGSLGQVTMSPDADASRVAVTSSDGKVYVWARDSGQLLAVMRRHSDAADEATFDPADLDHMYSAGDDGFMVSYTCEVCALGPDELMDAAEDRLAQEIDLDD